MENNEIISKDQKRRLSRRSLGKGRQSERRSFASPKVQFQVSENVPEDEKLVKLVEYSYKEALKKCFLPAGDNADLSLMIKAETYMEEEIDRLKEKGMFKKAITETEMPMNKEVEEYIQLHKNFNKRLQTENHEWKVLLQKNMEAAVSAGKKPYPPLEVKLNAEHETLLSEINATQAELLEKANIMEEETYLKVKELSNISNFYAGLQCRVEKRIDALEKDITHNIKHMKDDQRKLNHTIEEILQDTSLFNASAPMTTMMSFNLGKK